MLYCLGLDVSKATLGFCLPNAAGDPLARGRVPNDPTGFDALLAVLRRVQVEAARVRFVLEATGVYGARLVEFLPRAGRAVAVVNPAQIKYFGVACLRRQRALRLRQLQAQLDALDAAVAAHLQAHPALQAQAALLTSIPGIAAVTAAKLLAALAGKAFEHGRQLVAYAGLNPAHHQSGARRGTTTLSKVGHRGLRKALFMPAAVARRWCPALQAWADGLAARGLKPLQVRAAVMRQLLLAAYAGLKHQTPFDADKLCLPKTLQPA